MAKKYDHESLESKWQTTWERSDLYATEEHPAKKKFYTLDMFPYPSGEGLHVGHPEGYIATDIIARKRRMEGWSVLHPIGWDAFGLPAENYAIKTKTHVRESTAKNIKTFIRQLKSLGFSYDWAREINTSDPSYYRWTQWMFLFLYKKGLAYKGKASVNWCDSCRTVLANEQVIEGACERCDSEVVQKDLEQWFFRVTDYADRLLEDLDKLDWPERIKLMQKNWIGRSEGTEISFKGTAPDGKDFEVPVFTTRPDTLFGVSAVVLAPEHPLVGSITAPDRSKEIDSYREEARGKSELERMSDQEKTGVPLGTSVQHPLTGEDVPVWIADYALLSYGTGAVMVVPAHDDRDFEFAGKFRLPVSQVISPPEGVEAGDGAYTEPGFMVNSGKYDGMASDKAKESITDELILNGCGQRQINYHLRDWLISRQRYWGAPIPIIYCDKCGEVPVPEEDLPVSLPDDVDFMPTGESPLVASKSFHDVKCPKCRGSARRESDTMDTFVDSSWYFLRYASPNEEKSPFNRLDVDHWLPVDLYVGGAEHAVMHLLYARFFTKVLFDEGELGFDEPFIKLRNPGLILGENGEKMSKSRGNVINPDEVVGKYGADTFRMYEMFMGEFEDAKPWDTKGIVGIRRFLDRALQAVRDMAEKGDREVPAELNRLMHRTIKKVGEDIEAFRFNTAISAMMIFLNEWNRAGGGNKEMAGVFTRLLCPFAPHMAEELWEILGNKESVFLSGWPQYNPKLIASDTVEIVVQVDGKVRDRIRMSAGSGEEEVKEKALACDKVQESVKGREILRVVVVQDKIVNIVLS